MTAKEKARDLVHKFSMEIFFYISNNLSDIEELKRFALIAVDEIYSNNTDESRNDYWIEVKQEIENI